MIPIKINSTELSFDYYDLLRYFKEIVYIFNLKKATTKKFN